MFKGFFSVAVSILASIFASYSMAQTPTSEQIKMFQNLPAEQQQALASKYGFSVPSAPSSDISSFENPQLIKPREQTSSAISSNLEEQWLNKRGKGELKRFGLELFLVLLVRLHRSAMSLFRLIIRSVLVMKLSCSCSAKRMKYIVYV